MAVAAMLVGQRYYFATGHQAVVSTIRWAPAFVGLDEANILLSGALVMANYLGGHLLALAWLVPADHDSGPVHWGGLRGGVLVRLVLAAASMATVWHLRRHLMVWKIFAPRYACPNTWGLHAVG